MNTVDKCTTSYCTSLDNSVKFSCLVDFVCNICFQFPEGKGRIKEGNEREGNAGKGWKWTEKGGQEGHTLVWPCYRDKMSSWAWGSRYDEAESDITRAVIL